MPVLLAVNFSRETLNRKFSLLLYASRCADSESMTAAMLPSFLPVMHSKTFCKRDKQENQCHFGVHQKLFMSCLRVCSLQEKNSKDSCEGFEEFCMIKKHDYFEEH